MRVNLFDCVISLVLISTELGLVFPVLSYLKYITLFLAPIIIASGKKQGFSFEIQALKSPFLFFLFLSSLIHAPWLNLIGFINIIIWLSVFLFVTSMPSGTIVNYKFINLSLLVPLFVLVAFRDNVQFDFSLEALIASETSTMESNMLPFIAGFFGIYWFAKKNRIFFLINCIILFLTFKRIVIFAFFVGLCVYGVPKIRAILKPKILLFFNLIYVGFTFWMATKNFDYLVQEYTGVSAGFLTKGRTSLISPILDYIKQRPMVLLFGIGQGNAVVYISEHFGFRTLLHNDVLKVLIEHGIFIFLIFFRSLYKMKGNVLGLLIYFNILLLTDNVIIYSPVLLTFVIILNFESSNDENKLLKS